MEKLQLRAYQIEAIHAIQEALKSGQKRIVIEMISGIGKRMVLAKTIEYIQKSNIDKILIVIGNSTLKEQLEHEIHTSFNNFIKLDYDSIFLETRNRLLKYTNKQIFEYDIVILYDDISMEVFNTLCQEEKTIVAFTTIDDEIPQGNKKSKTPFSSKDIVFSYSFKDAINDGYMTPAMNVRSLESAIEVFSKHLLEQFGFTQFDSPSNKQYEKWDLILQKDKQIVLVEYKYYKSQVVSISVANELLKTIVMKKNKHVYSQDDIILLIVLSNIPNFQKDDIYKRYRIIVWDIENLVFYSKNNPGLLKQLSQITYFPIEQIEGRPSVETGMARLLFSAENEHLKEVKEETDKATLLIRKLSNCTAGRENSKEYEEICEEIIRHLFEANYFNRLTRQHKTNDEHFRMDLIGSLKINQINDQSVHPLWQMILQHYNSHFVVFEFKNYANKIDQNLIYITEKYLFNAALRNVAFIISRKGFSNAAKFAAEGCLKEHGKLILDITQEDLIKMLKSPSDNPADYILTIVEEFLMGISK